jgi:hypothetical protein
MQAHLKCKLRLLALALVTSLRDVTLFGQINVERYRKRDKIAKKRHIFWNRGKYDK